MATQRENPYGAFNFLVQLGGQGGDLGSIIGGFSDVSGLGNEVNYSEYRNGNELFNTNRKVPNTNKNDDITLKRGLMGATELFQWLKEVRDGAQAPKELVITLLNEARESVAAWRIRKAQPKKWMGPSLAAKGGAEVAMEELTLVHEGIDYE